MSTPTVLEASDSTTDPEGKKYGAPDVVHIVKLLKGTHGSEKIQVAAINDAVSLTGTQTLTNKTIAYSSNTLTDVASLATAQTLTNKTVDFATNTLTGVASTSTAQTLTNKTINAASNTLPDIFPQPDVRIWGAWVANGGLSSSGFGMFSAITQVTTSAALGVNNGTDGKHATMTTGATLNNKAGFRVTTGGSTVRAKEARFKAKFRMNNTTNCRLYVGLTSRVAANETTDTPLNNASGMILFVSAGGTNFQIARNDGSATQTVTEIGAGTAVNTSIHTVEVRVVPGDTTTMGLSLDGGAFTDYTTVLPALGTALVPHCSIETSEAVDKSIDIWYVMAEQKQ